MSKLIQLICAILLIGCVEPELELRLQIRNDLNQNLDLYMYTRTNGQMDTTLISLSPGEIYQQEQSIEGSSSDTYPTDLHGIFPPADTLGIYFNDTIVIYHIRHLRIDQDTSLNPAVIFYDQDRNIFNPNNFVQRELEENFFEGSYYITQSDLDFAISIYE